MQATLGLGVAAFLGEDRLLDTDGWDEAQRQQIRSMIKAREMFLDFPFKRTNADGSEQNFRISGEPMFDNTCRYIGYRGIGSEVR